MMKNAVSVSMECAQSVRTFFILLAFSSLFVFEL